MPIVKAQITVIQFKADFLGLTSIYRHALEALKLFNGAGHAGSIVANIKLHHFAPGDGAQIRDLDCELYFFATAKIGLASCLNRKPAKKAL